MVTVTCSPGQDVRDRLGEDVGALLIEQRGDVAGVLGVLVDGAGFLAALDEAAHGAVADLDGHVVDGGVLWQREGIDGFDVLGGGVGKNLRDRHAGEEAADAGANVGVLQRAGALHFAVLADDRERAWGCARSFSGRGEHARLRGDDQEQQESKEN